MVTKQPLQSPSGVNAELERDFLASISLDAPWPIVEHFAGLTRLSGSHDEATAVQLLMDCLQSWGVPHTRHEIDCFISIPIHATIKSIGEIGSDRVFRAKTSAMSISTNGQEISGELIYVPGVIGGNAGDVISATVDLGNVQAQGKIVITEGMPFPGKVSAVTAAGALGGVFVSPGHNIHESICTPIWGTPDLDTTQFQPSIPVVAVNNADGLSLIDMAKAGGRVAFSTSLDTRWRTIPILVAEIPGQMFPDEYVLLHGHLDSWHVGIGDNATGDAAMLEIARVAWAMRDRLDRSLRVAWWSGHSHGRYAGSTWYADTFAIDLAKNCIAQVNCDSPGCRWATTFNDLTAMSESVPLVHSVITDVTGLIPTPARPPRAGDYSFNSIGITGYYMLSSTMSQEDRVANNYYAVGGCGGNIAWHTEDDDLEIADPEFLLRDIRVYSATILRTLNSQVHPFDWRLTTAEFSRNLESYQEQVQGVFDFSTVKTAITDLETALDRFYSVAMRGDLDYQTVQRINAVQRRLGRILIPVNFSRAVPFRHDLALNVPPLPDLAAAISALEQANDPDYPNMLKAHLLRGQNRLIWALILARETVEFVIHPWLGTDAIESHVIAKPVSFIHQELASSNEAD